MGAGGLSGFDFDTPIDRTGTHSEKYDLRCQLFGTDAVEPLWVADMDFAAPPAVQQALAARVAHPVYGYTLIPDSVPQALAGWLARRHGWHVDAERISLVPGVVPTLYAAVAAFTRPGEAVIVQPPVYPPLFDAVTRQGRVLLENPLRQDDCIGHAGRLGTRRWCMDLEGLESLARRGARLLLLCSPHNPVGRVWGEDELRAVLDIARRHGMAILSDEIHADLVYVDSVHTAHHAPIAPGAAAAASATPPPQHVPLGRLATADDVVVTAVAPSKTFNIPGLGLAAVVASSADPARALREVFDRMPVSVANPLGLAAFEAAYSQGDAWLDACLGVLARNRDTLMAALGVPGAGRVQCLPPQATYLAWLDCRAARLDDAALARAWVDAGLGLSPGLRFGRGGSGFMRLNFAVSPSRIVGIANRLRRFSRA